jgi:DNA polymerase-3 subunit delta
MQNLNAGKFAPVYVLHGEEQYFIDAIADYIAEHALSDSEKVFNQMVCYGKDTSSRDVVDSARQYPMLAQHRVIILKEANTMRDLQDLEPYVARPSESTILVICHPHGKIDGRKALLKTARNTAVVFESKRLYDNQVPSWIERKLKEQGYQIDPAASMTLVEYLGNDLSKVANELGKLLLQLDDGKLITQDHVFDNIGISKEYNVFELQKALGTRDPIAVERILRQFVANMKLNPMPFVTASLYSYFTKLLVVRAMASASDRELGSAIGLRSTYFLKEYRTAAARYPVKELERIISLLKRFDLYSKGVGSRSRNDDELLRDLIGEILYARAAHSKVS